MEEIEHEYNSTFYDCRRASEMIYKLFAYFFNTRIFHIAKAKDLYLTHLSGTRSYSFHGDLFWHKQNEQD